MEKHKEIVLLARNLKLYAAYVHIHAHTYTGVDHVRACRQAEKP